jgi:hypothetical protein
MKTKLIFRAPVVRNYRKSIKYNLIVDQEKREILLGLLLGDLFAEKPSLYSNTRLQFKQSVINKEYINHLFTIFKIYCISHPKEIRIRDNRPNKKESYDSIKF